VDSRLSNRGRAHIPDPAVAHDFLVAGMEAWGVYYEAIAALNAATSAFENGSSTRTETLSAIGAISIV